MRFERFPIVLALLLTLSLATAPMFGQSLTTGNITGTVFDPSHAVVPNAPVSLKGLDTGSTASTITNASGGYSFGLLKPGRYQVIVKQAGFAEVAQTVEVEVGQTSKVDIESDGCEGHRDRGSFRNGAAHQHRAEPKHRLHARRSSAVAERRW